MTAGAPEIPHAAPPSPLPSRRGAKRAATTKRALPNEIGAPEVVEGEYPNGVTRRRSQRLRTSRAKPMSIVLDDDGNARTVDGHVGKGARLVGGKVVEDQHAGNVRGQDAVGKTLKTTEGVSQAMHDLSKLEAELDRQMRRQRRNIEQSKLVVAEELPDGALGNRMQRVAGKSLDVDVVGTGRVLDGKGKTMEVSPEIDQPLEPWNGRLGYACLNTYLRSANPPVFCSRTCRLATIHSRSHPLKDETQPFHQTKNPPDTDKPADPARGLAYVQSLGLANARDIIPMLRWNARCGIQFMRLSSEMFPFASHDEQGYDLGFAADVLAEAGRVAAELDHRVTTHPGQYTQLGSPRPEVVRNAVRDLEYHDQMLELLRLPEQLDRDAVMIIHMGGTFGDKAATLARFAENYAALRPSVKRRLVLENDDACWSVLDILPTCEELGIPLVLDWHHHTIIYDETMTGSHEELVPLLPRIAKTWAPKRITQKMHWSEPARPRLPDGSPAPGRERRKHSARCVALPPWRSRERVDMCIEAKDKEQAVFELMKRFRGKQWEWSGVGDVIPHLREGGPIVNGAKRALKAVAAAADGEDGGSGGSGGSGGEEGNAVSRDGAQDAASRDGEQDGGEGAGDPALDFGGANKRVYWPEGKEEWLRPKKRVRRAKAEDEDGAEASE